MVIGVDDALIVAGITAAAGGAASYFGQQEANDANRAISAGQMAYNAGQADLAYARNVDMMREVNERARYDAWVSRDWEADQAGIARNFNSAEAALNRDWNSQQAALSRDWSANQAQIARDWSANMSSTAYQRAMDDMRRAGLNPILAYQQGGAGTPSAAMASTQAATGSAASTSTPGAVTPGNAPGLSAPTAQSPAALRMESALGPAVNSAVQTSSAVMGLRRLASEIDQTQAQTALTQAQEQQSRSQTALNSASATVEAERANLISRQSASEEIMPSLRNAQRAAASAAAGYAQQQTVTEAERAALVREQTRREGAVANLERERWEQVRRYGQGYLGRETGSISQILQDVARSLGLNSQRTPP